MVSDKWYVADFETTNYEYYVQNGFTKVWLYAICDKEANITNYGTTIDEFISFIRTLYGKSIYFHNLKFDGSFIIDYLLNWNYEYTEDLKSVSRGFSVLIGEMGEYYSITIKFSKGKSIHIYDSLKLLPFKVEKIAKDFKLPLLKGKIDYGDYTVNETSLAYVFNDVKIVAMALAQIKANGMTKMTTASCAYSQYTSMKSDDFLVNAFPKLEDDILENFRKAYRGGRSQVNPIYQNKILRDVRRFDINSMYPYIMHDMELPYGLPIKITEPNTCRFEIYHIQAAFSLKSGHLPSLLKKGSLYNADDTYYTDTDGIEDLWISNIDLELLFRNYDVFIIKYLELYGFKTSKLMFYDYIDKWYALKQVDEGAKKAVDKFMLNCLYGKFGSNHKGYHKIPVFDDIVGTFKLVKSEEEEMKHYYLPIAIAVTSYAHLLIDNAIHNTGLENFVYCDTDSVHTLGTLPSDMVDNVKLGKFKLEGIEERSKYVRQKCYVYKDKKGINITCAGMPDNMKEASIKIYGDDIFNVFGTGFKMFGKLIPKRVKGGTVLYETTFEIK